MSHDKYWFDDWTVRSHMTHIGLVNGQCHMTNIGFMIINYLVITSANSGEGYVIGRFCMFVVCLLPK